MWVFGKVEPGWYLYRQVWNDKDAQHLIDLGYEVSKKKPY